MRSRSRQRDASFDASGERIHQTEEGRKMRRAVPSPERSSWPGDIGARLIMKKLR